MGTRHLTIVKLDGKFPIANYGQWDGYPSGQGLNILHYVRGEAVEKRNYKGEVNEATPVVQFQREALVHGLAHVYEPTPEQMKALYVAIGMDSEAEWMTIEQSQKLFNTYPSLSRDTGSDILKLVQNATAEKPLPIVLMMDFGKDTLMCEYVHMIDLDANRVEVYYNYPGEVIASYDLMAPPEEDEFLALFKDAEEEA